MARANLSFSLSVVRVLKVRARASLFSRVLQINEIELFLCVFSFFQESSTP